MILIALKQKKHICFSLYADYEHWVYPRVFGTAKVHLSNHEQCNSRLGLHLLYPQIEAVAKMNFSYKILLLIQWTYTIAC